MQLLECSVYICISQCVSFFFFFSKQKPAYEIQGDWSSDVCSSDLNPLAGLVTDADAKGPRIGGAALSADGRTLFAVGQTGLVAIDTATLKVRLRILSGETVDSIRDRKSVV